MLNSVFFVIVYDAGRIAQFVAQIIQLGDGQPAILGDDEAIGLREQVAVHGDEFLFALLRDCQALFLLPFKELISLDSS